MTPFEYLLPLVSVVVGLAIADLGTSLHRLLRARARVEWDALPLMAALLAMLVLLEFWWRLFAAQDAANFQTLGSFLPLGLQLLVLFLVNAAALPDALPAEGAGPLVLADFYNENARYFWTLFASYAVVMALFGGTGTSLILAALFAGLAFWRKRQVHALALGALLLLLVVEWWDLAL